MIDAVPDRPDEAAWLQARERRWLPVLAVFGVIVFTTIGGYVAAALLATPAGPPVGVPGVVSVQPIAGWETAGPGTTQGHPYVSLTRGIGTLVVVDRGPATDAESLSVGVVDDVLGAEFEQLSVSDQLEPVILADGTTGKRFRFVGVDPHSGGSIEGEATVVVTPSGRGVVFIGLAPEGQLSFVDGDLRTMVDRAQVS